jgi:hypothetical protein
MAKFGRNGAGPVRPQGPGSLERLKALEDFRGEILRAVRQTFQAIEQRLQNLEEVNEACVNLIGRTQVEEEVKRLHIERVEARSAMETAALEQALKDGKIKEVETIGDMSVVVGSEVDKDGNKLYPSRVQLLFATLHKEYQDKLRGARGGDSIETPMGSKFTVATVYDVIPQAEQVPPPPLPAGTPPVDAEPLDAEAEAKLVEQLSDAAAEIEAEAKAVEEQLVEDLAGQTAG